MSRYTPVAQLLPSVFKADRDSFEQVGSFLGLADEILRGHAERIEEISSWLSPNGPAAAWPPDTAFDAGADPVIASYLRLYDELARWTGFVFPDWWVVDLDTDDDGVIDVARVPDLQRRRDYLARAARLWRRRGTPRGFVDWISFAFRIEDAHRPYLLEHFKFGRPSCPDAAEPGPEPELRASLLVPSTESFDRPEMRRLLMAFVETYAPAHIHMRVCWVAEDFDLFAFINEDGDPDTILQPGSRLDAVDLAAWDEAVDALRTHVSCVLCSLVDETTHETALRIADCIDEGEARDRLGIGRLPGGGVVPQ